MRRVGDVLAIFCLIGCGSSEVTINNHPPDTEFYFVVAASPSGTLRVEGELLSAYDGVWREQYPDDERRFVIGVNREDFGAWADKVDWGQNLTLQVEAAPDPACVRGTMDPAADAYSLRASEASAFFEVDPDAAALVETSAEDILGLDRVSVRALVDRARCGSVGRARLVPFGATAQLMPREFSVAGTSFPDPNRREVLGLYRVDPDTLIVLTAYYAFVLERGGELSDAAGRHVPFGGVMVRLAGAKVPGSDEHELVSVGAARPGNVRTARAHVMRFDGLSLTMTATVDEFTREFEDVVITDAGEVVALGEDRSWVWPVGDPSSRRDLTLGLMPLFISAGPSGGAQFLVGGEEGQVTLLDDQLIASPLPEVTDLFVDNDLRTGAFDESSADAMAIVSSDDPELYVSQTPVLTWDRAAVVVGPELAECPTQVNVCGRRDLITPMTKIAATGPGRLPFFLAEDCAAVVEQRLGSVCSNVLTIEGLAPFAVGTEQAFDTMIYEDGRLLVGGFDGSVYEAVVD